MKKLLFLAIMAMCTMSVSAKGSVTYKTSCGIEGTTVGPEFFDSYEEFVEYLHELNVIACDEDGDVEYTEIV